MTGTELSDDFRAYLDTINLSKRNKYGIINRYLSMNRLADYRITEMLSSIYDAVLKQRGERK